MPHVPILTIWQKIWGGLILLLCSFFVAQHGAAFAVLDLLVLVGIGYLLFSWKKSISVISAEILWVGVAVWIYVALSLGTVIWHGDYGRSHARLLYYIALIPLVIVSLYRLKISVECFWWSVCFGAIVAGVFAVFDVYVDGLARAGGSMGKPIVFGDLSLILGLLSLVSILHFVSRGYRFVVLVVPVISFFCGLLASLLSQSRGGWLFLPVVFVGVLALYRTRLYSIANAHKWLTLVFLASAFCLAWGLIGPVWDRVSLAWDQLVLYVVKGDESSPIGIRIELWRVAVGVVSEFPLLGIGIDNFHPYVKNLVDDGLLDQSAVFQHAHNQFFHALATTGLIGFLGLMTVFLMPTVVFLRAFQLEDRELRALSLAGLVLVFGFATFCLTDSLLFVPHSVKFYFFMLVTLGFFVSQRRKRLESAQYSS